MTQSLKVANFEVLGVLYLCFNVLQNHEMLNIMTSIRFQAKIKSKDNPSLYVYIFCTKINMIQLLSKMEMGVKVIIL